MRLGLPSLPQVNRMRLPLLAETGLVIAEPGERRRVRYRSRAHVARLNARGTTLAFASRAPQPEVARLKARMGWEMVPRYTITDDFDADFGVAEYYGTNAFIQGAPYLLFPRRRMYTVTSKACVAAWGSICTWTSSG
ncbi:MAG TPA: DUF899 family protein [Streptosporangiaceae bacterium]|nr:DUF899 family protein [Streptosporangiaceae bacterium]